MSSKGTSVVRSLISTISESFLIFLHRVMLVEPASCSFANNLTVIDNYTQLFTLCVSSSHTAILGGIFSKIIEDAVTVIKETPTASAEVTLTSQMKCVMAMELLAAAFSCETSPAPSAVAIATSHADAETPEPVILSARILQLFDSNDKILNLISTTLIGASIQKPKQLATSAANWGLIASRFLETKWRCVSFCLQALLMQALLKCNSSSACTVPAETWSAICKGCVATLPKISRTSSSSVISCLAALMEFGVMDEQLAIAAIAPCWELVRESRKDSTDMLW